ncbi:beta-propeller domain-containing protein [Sorangium sp. So ce315]|uniref:beta-propeller domain-containing protein n=1 Tax=Sorangium sp. So ce315 TaxID=3133299 RepID=UPI003F5D8283
MRTHRALSSLWLLLATGLLAAGCDPESPPDGPQSESQSAALQRAQSCDDLEALLKQDALTKMNAQVDAMIASYAVYGEIRGGGGVIGVDNGLPGGVGASPNQGADPSAPSPAPSGGEAPSGGDGSGAADEGGGTPTYSDTNTQVAGVDEADIVKTDGNNIYVLHGQSFYTLAAWPASSLAVGSSLAIEGQPREMFVADDKVVVYSDVNGASIYEKAGVEPRPAYYDYVLVDSMVGGGVARPVPGGAGTPDTPPEAPGSGGGSTPMEPSGGDTPVPPDGGGADDPDAPDAGADEPDTPASGGGADDPDAPASDGEPSDPDAPADDVPGGGPTAPTPIGEPLPDDAGEPWVYAPLTKLTVLSLAGGAPGVIKELYFEGSYTSARRAGEDVRTVLNGGAHGPALVYWPESLVEYPETAEAWAAAFEQLRAENTAIIEAAPLSTWLPYRFEKEGDTVTELGASCADFYVPGAGTTSYGLTQIESIDLGDLDETPASTSIIGATDTVYSSHDALYVAARGWQQPASPGAAGEPFIVSDVTHLHKFDLTTDPSQPRYVASGSVPGHILNQFSLDEHNGKLRVATTAIVPAEPRWTTSNSVFVLEAQGADLARVGAVTDLAPGEHIRSARFFGDRGYVVTFLQVDPLFVLDLSDPAAPSVTGELKIPGFSEYLHPLGDGHLLAIGRDADDSGRVTGLALQIFDVTDPSAPAQVHKETIEGPYASSEAEHNHKAFTYYGERGVLAFPLVSYDRTTGAVASTLELFNVDIEDGFSRLGAVDHSGFFTTPTPGCYYYGSADVRRGLFIEDYVYSISHGGVLVNALDDLATPVASVALPAPAPSYACGDGGVAEPAPPPAPDGRE